nr:pyruvate, phosphate dikinase [FCB group bacterium]
MTNEQQKGVEGLVLSLQERAKELNCIYQIEEVVQKLENDINGIFTEVVTIITQAMQYPNVCQTRIIYKESEYTTPGFQATEWKIASKLFVQGVQEGTVEISYTEELPGEDIGPFLKEELKLLHTITDRLGHNITYHTLKQMMGDFESIRGDAKKADQDWQIVRDLLLQTDKDLFIRVAHKLLNYLWKEGVAEAEDILHEISSDKLIRNDTKATGSNVPSKRKHQVDRIKVFNSTFEVAARHLDQRKLMSLIQRWMQEDKASFFIRTLGTLHSTLDDICNDIRRFHQLLNQTDLELSDSMWKSIHIQLIRRILSEQTRFINVAKIYVKSADFLTLVPRLIYPPSSHGKLGGKGTGLFLASAILRNHPELSDIKTPRTWYLTSDGLHYLLHYNDLEDLLAQKYKDIAQIRQEYPQIIEILKNAVFAPEIVQKLSIALDDLGDGPLIVRSSSLLEDRFGSTFSGKYESFFVANQGTKEERLIALMEAISEVYASIFSPDAIEYRIERDLQDFHEQMGVLIQEVVGTRIGPYFFPAYAGVAFSKNEFRWSPRIKQEDGLIRLVMGLGTRAVDRLGDWVAGQTLSDLHLSREGVTVLGIQRSD